jgi:hypothetical protein
VSLSSSPATWKIYIYTFKNNFKIDTSIQIKQPKRCNSFKSLLLDFMYGSTCFGRPSAHHQERTTAIRASGFTVGIWRLERCWSWSGITCQTTTNNFPTATLQRSNQRLLVQLYAPDDGRKGARNMLSHT